MAYRAIGETIRQLALEAGAETMRFFQTEALNIESKDDDSPVTAADKAADRVIVEALEKAFPDIRVVTEERASSQQEPAPERFFLVDPLDGTKEFISGRGEFTVNIALIENGEARMGAVFAPAIGRLFWTPEPDFAVEEIETDEGFAIEEVGETKRLSVRDADNEALSVVASKSHRDQATDDYIGKYKVETFKSAGSSLKFCLVAAGDADLYPRLGRTMEWDTAAAHAVLRAAGGRITRFDAPTQDLSYGKPGFENPFFIAAAPSVALLSA